MMTQYFDALREIGQVSNTILMPHSPSVAQDLYGQLRNSITAEHGEVRKLRCQAYAAERTCTLPSGANGHAGFQATSHANPSGSAK